MLSIFPSLLTYGLLAPLILRLAAALQLGYSGYKLLGQPAAGRLIGATQLLAALLLFVGLWTQPVALILALLIVVWPDRTIPAPQRSLMIVILLSLVFTGPGFLAIDLPL
jgi:uncharacterized membrane protein YphA (DoxX/SURF4 family)